MLEKWGTWRRLYRIVLTFPCIEFKRSWHIFPPKFTYTPHICSSLITALYIVSSTPQMFRYFCSVYALNRSRRWSYCCDISSMIPHTLGKTRFWKRKYQKLLSQYLNKSSIDLTCGLISLPFVKFKKLAILIYKSQVSNSAKKQLYFIIVFLIFC